MRADPYGLRNLFEDDENPTDDSITLPGSTDEEAPTRAHTPKMEKATETETEAKGRVDLEAVLPSPHYIEAARRRRERYEVVVREARRAVRIVRLQTVCIVVLVALILVILLY